MSASTPCSTGNIQASVYSVNWDERAFQGSGDGRLGGLGSAPTCRNLTSSTRGPAGLRPLRPCERGLPRGAVSRCRSRAPAPESLRTGGGTCGKTRRGQRAPTHRRGHHLHAPDMSPNSCAVTRPKHDDVCWDIYYLFPVSTVLSLHFLVSQRDF